MKKTAGKKRKIWLAILLSILILLCSVCFAGILLFKHYYGMMNIEREEDIYEEQTMLVWEDEETIPNAENSDTMPSINNEDMTDSSEYSETILNSESSENTADVETTSTQTNAVTIAEESKVIETTKTIETTKSIETTQETFNALEGLEISERIFRVIFIGVDSRENNVKGRSDSMILFDINPDTKKIVMTSFLRDIYVSIPGYGENRLNAAYAFGGAKLLTKTIYGSFGIEVDKYVTINFDIVRDVVDALGGVEVKLTQEEVDYLNSTMSSKDRLPTNKGGKVTLNGNQALAYARIRKLDSDFGRTNRQRNVVTACIEKVKKMGIFQINDMLEKFLPRVTTNLTEKDVLTLLLMAVKRKDYSIESMAIPVTGTWQYATIQGKAVIQIDFAANAKAWYDKITGK